VANLLKRFRSQRQTDWPALPLQDWVNFFNYSGQTYPYALTSNSTSLDGHHEDIPQTFAGYVEGIYKRNSVVFACMEARRQLFSEARFQYQRVLNGVPGKLFGTQGLSLLEDPWQNGTSGDLLSRMISDADLSGNAYMARVRGVNGPELMRLRPDWVTIVIGSRRDVDTVAGDPGAEILGYIYVNKDRREVGGNPGNKPDVTSFLAEEVAHFAPIPDPTANFRGMSWLSPLLGDALGDQAITTQKSSLYENAAYLQTVVTLSEDIEEDAFNDWITTFNTQHQGTANAYKTLFLGGGADVKVLGADVQKLDLTSVQAHSEARICMAARVPAILAGVSEGLDSATYSNYQTARRVFADGTMRPLWREACASLQKLVPPERNSRLWYDDRHISFLREDGQDAAKIRQTNAVAIRELINAGFDPESVVKAVNNDDLSQLDHTGLVSVQLQPPGSDVNNQNTAAPGGPGGNGNGALLPGGNGSNSNTNGNGNGKPQLPSGVNN
jgi:phage portal protein BeeE